VPLSLAPHDDLTSAPIDIVKLCGDDLLSAETETREQKNHGVVSPPESGITPDSGKDSLHLFRRQVTGKPRRISLSHLRDAERQIGAGQSLLE
jgi:hypothetical protein